MKALHGCARATDGFLGPRGLLLRVGPRNPIRRLFNLSPSLLEEVNNRSIRGISLSFQDSTEDAAVGDECNGLWIQDPSRPLTLYLWASSRGLGHHSPLLLLFFPDERKEMTREVSE